MKQVNAIFNAFNLFLYTGQGNQQKMSSTLKARNTQILALKEENKKIKEINKNDKINESHELKEQLEDVSYHLNNRDNEFKVTIDCV